MFSAFFKNCTWIRALSRCYWSSWKWHHAGSPSDTYPPETYQNKQTCSHYLWWRWSITSLWTSICLYMHECVGLCMHRPRVLPGSYQWPTHPRCWSWPGECSGLGQTGSGTNGARAGAGMEPAAPQPWLRSCGNQKLLPEKEERSGGRKGETDRSQIEINKQERGLRVRCVSRIPCGSSTWHDDWPGSWTCRRDLVGSGHWPMSRAPCMWSGRDCQESLMQEGEEGQFAHPEST